MIICIDVDGILNDLVSKTLTLYNSRNNKNIQFSDITKYRFDECLEKEDANGICRLFREKELWDSLRPLPYSQEGIQTLINNGHKIYLATATNPINFSWKIEWIEKYFPSISSDKVIRIMDKSLLKCDVMIDDCLDNLISNICERICLDYPWNQSKEKDFVYSIYRAKSWKDIVNIINDIERKDKEWEMR